MNVLKIILDEFVRIPGIKELDCMYLIDLDKIIGLIEPQTWV